MLEDYRWDLNGYTQEVCFQFSEGITRREAEHIFQLKPEPPATEYLNDYILLALQKKNLDYFSFFLHHYEGQLNQRIRSFLRLDGTDGYDPERFLDIKLSCLEIMLQKLPDYDPEKGAKFATYIYPFIRESSRLTPYEASPSQNRTCGFPASGSLQSALFISYHLSIS